MKKTKEKIKIVDLFCGIGGFRLGLMKGFNTECVFSCDIDSHARKTYYTNFKHDPAKDICDVDENDIPDHDILCGGFPCQPYSTIGKREGLAHPTKGQLFFEICRILKKKRPRALFLENVSGLINHDKGETMKTILRELTAIGYNVQYKVLDALDYGLPARRKRVYFVGFLDETVFEFPLPTVDCHASIGGFIESHPKKYCIYPKTQKYLFKKNDGRPEIVDRSTDKPVKTLVSTYHKVQRLTGTFVRDGDTGLRLLSENECKAIMGFPKDFEIPVSRTQMYRQFGNSVAVPVIASIAESMAKVW